MSTANTNLKGKLKPRRTWIYLALEFTGGIHRTRFPVRAQLVKQIFGGVEITRDEYEQRKMEISRRPRHVQSTRQNKRK